MTETAKEKTRLATNLLERLFQQHVATEYDDGASSAAEIASLRPTFMAGAMAVDKLYNQALAADQYRGRTTGQFQLLELSNCSERIVEEIRAWLLKRQEQQSGAGGDHG